QPADCNPEWQCPACHVAYNKVPAPGDVAAAYRARPTHASAHRSSLSFGKGVLAAIFMALAFFGHRHYGEGDGKIPVAATPPQIILYGTESCGYCRAARQFFARNGIEYQDMDVERSLDAHTEFRNLGGRGVPLFVI